MQVIQHMLARYARKRLEGERVLYRRVDASLSSAQPRSDRGVSLRYIANGYLTRSQRMQSALVSFSGR
jgi:hypothetical protein